MKNNDFGNEKQEESLHFSSETSLNLQNKTLHFSTIRVHYILCKV